MIRSRSLAVVLSCALGACAGDEGQSDRGPGESAAAGAGGAAAPAAGSGGSGALRPTPRAGSGATATPADAGTCAEEFCEPVVPPPGSCPDGADCAPQEPQDCAVGEIDGRSFCDAATWGGSAPGAESDIVIPSGEVVLLDCDAHARTLEIEPGGVLRASHEHASQLTLHGNLVVRGRLEYGRPGCRIPQDVRAEIVFTGMHDGDYEGTPSTVFGEDFGPSADTELSVLASDIGLWVIDDGVFTAAGALKRAWSFLTEGAGPGDAELVVEDGSGWLEGDRIVLTPTAERVAPDHAEQFDEGEIAGVDGTRVTLAAAPAFAHAGCSDCMRRGEALDLSRNVVVRSADDTAHAHMMVAARALLQLDSVELRWLGPEWSEESGRCGGPERRAPIYFHQQDDASQESFVRHVAVWGGQSHFAVVERSHGIEIADVAGYDTFGSGVELSYDTSACGTRCEDRDTAAPRDIVMREVIAAKVGVARRAEGCARIGHRHSGIVVSGGEGSGCKRCVATGVGYEGSGADMAGFAWQEGGSGRPLEFTFDDNVAHNNRNHGAFIWHNGANPQAPYRNDAFWSNDGYGIHWGAYNNAFVLQGFTAVDNGLASVGVKAVPADERARLDGATLDDLRVLAYVLVQSQPNILRDLTFTGARPVAFTQIHDPCENGDETDPEDPECTRIWLRIENPVLPSGVKPFDFGWSANRAAVWEVRGFSHPDPEYRDLPADFDLYRRDNQVAGGSMHAGFDAWLVPR